MPELGTRDYYDCYYQNGQRYCNGYQSSWNNWIRWVVLAVILAVFFLLFVICSCLTARRRRRAGQQPFYGTGWAARPGQGQNAQPYYNNQPAPPYSTHPNNNNTQQYGASQGYYGQQPYGQQGVELQPPQPTYGRGGDEVYAPPAGPPPGKGDGFVR